MWADPIFGACGHLTTVHVGNYSIQSVGLPTHSMTFERIILVDPPYFGHESFKFIERLHKVIRASNARRQRNWSTVGDAMKWLTARSPWKGFHPDVLAIISVSNIHTRCNWGGLTTQTRLQETFFREDPTDPSRITTKTSVEQETACYPDDASRLDTLQAAILEVKLKYLDDYIAARRKVADYYDQAFANHPAIAVPHRTASGHVFHQYTLILTGIDRNGLHDYLAARNVPSMIYYPVPAHRQKMFEAFGACRWRY